MSFKSSFSLVLALTVTIIGICFLLVYTHDLNNPKGAQIMADTCRESLHKLLSDIPSIKKWPPTAQLKVEVDDADAPSLKVSIRTIADAYYDKDSGDSVRLTAALAILEKKEWLLVESGIKCVPPYDEKSFSVGTIPWIAGKLNYSSLMQGFTSFLYKFTEKFYPHLKSKDMRLGTKTNWRKKILSHGEMFGETYTDSTFGEIKISTYSYALMWDPRQTIQSKIDEDLLKGAADPQKQFIFTVNIKVAGKTNPEIDQEIDAAAKKAADVVFDYLKRVSTQIET